MKVSRSTVYSSNYYGHFNCIKFTQQWIIKDEGIKALNLGGHRGLTGLISIAIPMEKLWKVGAMAPFAPISPPMNMVDLG